MKHLFTKTLFAAALACGVAGAANADQMTAPLPIGGTVGASCTASADALNLGTLRSQDLLVGGGQQLGLTLHVNCSAGTVYTIGVPVHTIIKTVGPQTYELGLGSAIDSADGTFVGDGLTRTGTGVDEPITLTNIFLRAQLRVPTNGVQNLLFSNAFTIVY
ncbi:Csu type fimbrial protein [Quatrionicoccus australiensis]|uniref:hypothetical protein n=1 Tax=Quatrionicoccus australiensis TaxID=138118 RepID=UPI001CFC1463|nr:hypothetical protein [Quatrionicoccus australiensis]MCB4359600.1 hypothetical protein [Quatrionicoccus australiensis]